MDFSELPHLHGHWDRRLLRKLAATVVRNEASRGNFAVSLHLLDDAAVQELNRNQRGVDAATDVLSFPLYDPAGLRFVLPPDEPLHLGDVVVSYSRAERQAAEYGHSIKRELAYLITHGLLHLLGYDHERPEEQQAMRDKEETALGALGLPR